MKKIIAALSIAILFAATVNAAVLITQVYYDPRETETGGEAVELYNTGELAENISRWTIKTKSSAFDATIPKDTFIEPNAFFLIADAGWSLQKDNESWPDADYEEALTLSNTNAGIALIDTQGIAVDAIGWGEPSIIGEGLFEGTPWSIIPEGTGLSRIFEKEAPKDTDDNLNDFAASDPNPRSSLFPGWHSKEVDVVLNATNRPMKIQGIKILEGKEKGDKTELLAFPGKDKNITVQIQVQESNSDPIEHITLMAFDSQGSMNLIGDDNGTKIFESKIILKSNQTPKDYIFSASVTANSSENAVLQKTIAIKELAGIRINTTQIRIEGNKGLSDFNVENIGNIPLDFEITEQEREETSNGTLRYQMIKSSNQHAHEIILQGAKTRIKANLLPSQSVVIRARIGEWNNKTSIARTEKIRIVGVRAQ